MKKTTLLLLALWGFFAQAQTISHSTSMTLGTTNVACNSGTNPNTTSSDNTYYRFFVMSNYIAPIDSYSVGSVQFGVQTLNNPTLPAGFPVTVKIYATTASDFPTGYPTGYTELASVTTNITQANVGTIVSIPIMGTVPPGQNLLVTVGYLAQTAGSLNRIFLSGNNLGQTAPSYISSTGCTLANPTDLAAISFPNAHFVLSVTGVTLGANENTSTVATIFPNPSKGIYNIQLKQGVAIEKVNVTDISGKQIPIALDANNSFDISSYTTGVYFLNLQTSEGVLNKRLIKE